MKRSIELLPQVSFSILLALSLRPRHGYEIIQQIESDSSAKITIGPATLYSTLKKLIDSKLIEEIKIDGNARRRYYRLTQRGWQHLHSETAYYEQVSLLTKQRLSDAGGVS